MIGRLAEFARRARTHPLEAFDLLAGALESRWESITMRPEDYAIIPWDQAISGLESTTGIAIQPYLDEPELAAVRDAVNSRIARMDGSGPMPLAFNADTELSELCYALIRALRPEVIIVTGVAYGPGIAYLLAAQKVNGGGVLHAIDLPPMFPGAEDAIGALIPEDLRAGLTLHRGASSRVLPGLMHSLRGIDFFMHDSLHTAANIRRELDTITPWLRRPGIVVVDDSNQNPAVKQWWNKNPPAFSAVLQEEDKDTMCAVSLFTAV